MQYLNEEPCKWMCQIKLNNNNNNTSTYYFLSVKFPSISCSQLSCRIAPLKNFCQIYRKTPAVGLFCFQVTFFMGLYGRLLLALILLIRDVSTCRHI